MRRNARRHLPGILRDQDDRCHWCGRLLVLLRAIDPASILRRTHHLVHWQTADGESHSGLIASVDHVQRIADGGTNHRDNLVASCIRCNAIRNSQSTKGK